MMPVNSCLNAQQLQKLLNSTGNETELEPLTQHLGSCAECQVALQKVASGEIPVESLVVDNHAYRPEKDSAYWKAADMAKTFHQIRATSPPTQVTREVSTSLEGGTGLPFLEPPSDPAYIGRLDHFEIARVIGRGGMGIVLEAFDPHLQRSVAIKVLNPEYSKNTTARQRFCREGRAAAAISHEHVVPMYQVAKESDSKVAYLVMQLIDGDTLEDRLISRQPLPPGEVARIGMQIAAGLSAAHSRGMVHRDIKPANVMIERETNRVKLTDFGLARATDDVKLTKTGMVTGTPLYMSPEQATGAAADDRSDLFSFGAVLYEMATGESPFEAPSLVGVMKRVMDERPVPPQKLNPAIPTELSRIIMALLEKDPERRPESASAVAEQLAKIVTQFGPISPLHVPAVSASKSGRLSAASRRMPWLATSLSLIGIFSLLGAAGCWCGIDRGRLPAESARPIHFLPSFWPGIREPSGR